MCGGRGLIGAIFYELETVEPYGDELGYAFTASDVREAFACMEQRTNLRLLRGSSHASKRDVARPVSRLTPLWEFMAGSEVQNAEGQRVELSLHPLTVCLIFSNPTVVTDNLT